MIKFKKKKKRKNKKKNKNIIHETFGQLLKKRNLIKKYLNNGFLSNFVLKHKKILKIIIIIKN